MFDYNRIIDKYYPAGSPLRDIYTRHCRSVAELALEIARRGRLGLDEGIIEAAGMLHDIGIFLTDAPGIYCHGEAPYLLHGKLGADLLRREGAPEIYARVAERHTGAGLSGEDVEDLNRIIAEKGAGEEYRLSNDRIYLPRTELEQLICYADKFYSKSGDMKRKPLERVRRSIGKFGAASSERFEELERRFGSFTEESEG